MKESFDFGQFLKFMKSKRNSSDVMMNHSKYWAAFRCEKKWNCNTDFHVCSRSWNNIHGLICFLLAMPFCCEMSLMHIRFIFYVVVSLSIFMFFMEGSVGITCEPNLTCRILGGPFCMPYMLFLEVVCVHSAIQFACNINSSYFCYLFFFFFT